MYDLDPRSDDIRDRPRRELSQGSRGGSSDSRERASRDPRDVFTKDLDLPRGSERERVHLRDRDVMLRGSESRTLATVGVFRVVLRVNAADATREAATDGSASVWVTRRHL